MTTREKEVPIQIEDEMRNSYIDYSMSVIVSRALPDVRDGLKPVHRRVLVAMRELNLLHDRPFRKSAKITGDVTGNYHPHGTAAVYETMVRLAQPFSMRYPLRHRQARVRPPGPSSDGAGRRLAHWPPHPRPPADRPLPHHRARANHRPLHRDDRGVQEGPPGDHRHRNPLHGLEGRPARE